ncbi:MAG: ABC transporter permease [Bacteroidota bacterium]|nr:ABC transporter permease [Bacteroidota bacterium]
MFYKNFKQIARSLWLHKNFTSINLLGLSVGVAAVTIIFLIIKYERGFDRFHSDSENIYRIVVKEKDQEKFLIMPYPTLQHNF